MESVTTVNLNKMVDEYLTRTQNNRAHKTFLAYNRTLQDYLGVVGPKRPYNQLSREDVQQYIDWLRKQDCDNRTVYNRLRNLKTFYTDKEVPWPMKKTDRIRYTTKSVEAYSKEQLQRLFRVCDVDETDLFQFFLVTGGREQEVSNATYDDVDFDRAKFLIREKDGWIPKDKEEGSIPVPHEFIERMKARRERYPKTTLIFPNADGRPNGHFLRMLQGLAKRSGLNGEWGLHKFRKTFASLHHQNGVPVRTIQCWLRHSSLETTLRYLASGDDEAHRQKVNSTFSFV